YTRPYELVSYAHWSAEEDRIVAKLLVDGEEHEVTGVGNGPIAALVDGLERSFGLSVAVRDYHEHAMSASADATRRLRRGRRRRRCRVGRRAPSQHRHRLAARGRERGQPRARAQAVDRRSGSRLRAIASSAGW